MIKFADILQEMTYAHPAQGEIQGALSMQGTNLNPCQSELTHADVPNLADPEQREEALRIVMLSTADEQDRARRGVEEELEVEI